MAYIVVAYRVINYAIQQIQEVQGEKMQAVPETENQPPDTHERWENSPKNFEDLTEEVRQHFQ